MTALLRHGSTTLSALLLVVVNLVPLIGVAFWGWSLMLILVLYWIESGIVGAFNVLKMAAAQGTEIGLPGSRVAIRVSGMAGGLARGALIGFFIVHYGMFWLVHGVFVLTLPTFVPFGDGLVILRHLGFCAADLYSLGHSALQDHRRGCPSSDAEHHGGIVMIGQMISLAFALLGAAAVYGTDVFFCVVGRTALSHVSDTALVETMGRLQR